eukprot:CAMPEP_0177308008 /NCGR_PEP_ID=MMETSP0368-20130122/8546_1 /TAXON_ID=447022 ORGANISM="Scrippsiella hangoei-like, Strain SHHI-4" /NCGR_SAMPLE_ID=MMETSP0368 /ASSEMBLY_ACC=CAM_ASM_000363 /LENGTH=257 /DNA_ID=CAMNT_0018766811 /DNA_START=572 /DNA_END=1346 /DNA_ORIENTATION=-
MLGASWGCGSCCAHAPATSPSGAMSAVISWHTSRQSAPAASRGGADLGLLWNNCRNCSHLTSHLGLDLPIGGTWAGSSTSVVALQDLHHAPLRIVSQNMVGLIGTWLARIMRAMRERTQCAALAMRFTARASFVELWMVELLLAAVGKWTSHASWATVIVVQLGGTIGDAATPLWAWPGRVANQRRAPPIPVGVSIDTILPIVGTTDGTPLHLEPVRNEVLGGVCLFEFSEMRHKKLLSRVRECTIPAARTPLRLIA